MDCVEENGKHFLAIGVNKISKDYDSEEALLEGMAYDYLDIMFRLAITVNKIENNKNN